MTDKLTDSNGNILETRTNDDGLVTVTKSPAGILISRNCVDKTGRLTALKYGADGKELLEMQIERPDGLKATLAIDPADHAEIMKGTAYDASGKAVKTIRLWRDTMLLFEELTGKQACVDAEEVNFGVGEFAMPTYIAGKCDLDRRTFEHSESDDPFVELIRETANGQVEIVRRDGSTESTRSLCRQSSFRRGEAVVIHPNGDGATLRSMTADWTVEIWKGGRFTNTINLIPGEAQFIANHNVDPRDIAEIIRRFPSQYPEIFESLAHFDMLDITKVPTRYVILETLVHDLAFPGQDYQGTAPTCSAAAAQCLLSLTEPKLLVEYTWVALAYDYVVGKSGTKFDVDPLSMARIDDSFRSASERAIQTFIETIACAKRKEIYENSEDGEGRIIVKDANGNPKTDLFPGMPPQPLAAALRELTGKNYQVVEFTGITELYKAFVASGFRPMIANVDSSLPPITCKKQPNGTQRKGHYVTVVDMQMVKQAIKVRFHNQWQLKHDRSTEKTQADGDQFFACMLSKNGPNGKRIRGDRGSVIMVAPN